MAFKAGHVEYTEPRVKALVEKYEPDRFIGPYTTYWALPETPRTVAGGKLRARQKQESRD